MLEDIKGEVRSGLLEYSEHALDRSIRRDISSAEVRQAILGGKIIEDYPDHKYGPSCPIFGRTEKGRRIHAHVSYPSRPLVKVITVYEPGPEFWTNFEVKAVTEDAL